MPKDKSVKPKTKSDEPTGAFSRVPKRASGVLARTNPDHSLSLLHLDRDEKVYLIDGIAAEVFTMIDGRRSIAEIRAVVTQKHSPPREELDRDLTKFFRWLDREALIQAF